MAHFRTAGRSAATAATLGHVAAALWNPHATARPKVWEIHIAITTAAVANIDIRRTTVRGTPGSSVTADIDNSDSRDIAPTSGLVLDLAAFTAQPTVDASSLWRWNLPAVVGSGVILPVPHGITIPPGTGLAIVTPVGVAFPPSDIAFVWEE